MAITFIYPIKVTGEKSLDYDTENKETKLLKKTKNDSKDSLDYIMRDKKGNVYQLSSEYMEKMKNYISYDEKNNITFHTIKTSLNCTTENAHKEWEMVRKNSKNKRGDGGILQYCIVQNFGTDLDPMIANEIGVKFANEYLSDYQCVVSTHINTGFVHNHIEFNATSFATGKKFYDQLKTISEIRKISDKLCSEYELDVLEKTKDFNYIIYKDTNGKTKIYEPTERKNEIRAGEYSNKNDYRNTEQYKISTEFKNSHIKELKNDIDRFVPHATSYEDLLQQLRNIDYEIKDKTKKGEWRKQISFKAPTWDKFTRDSSLGKEYEREFLTQVIAENVKEKKEELKQAKNQNTTNVDFKESDIYMYGRMIIEDIDEEYRYKKKSKDKEEYEKVYRGYIEKYIIKDTKKLNKEINSIMRQSMFPKNENHTMPNATKKEQYLIDRINSNLRTLHFVEEKELRSFEQINDIVKSLYEKRNACYQQMNMISKALKNANADIVLIEKAKELKQVIERNSSNPDYVLYEKENDTMLLQKYENVLKEKGLLDNDRQEQFKMKYNKYNNTFLQLSKALETVNKDIKNYDECIYNIKSVDKNNGNVYASQIENYYSTKENYRNKNEENDRQER